ncbi:hypothetical protein XENTR_v10010330 [Xenopus tropicalis]|nr:hypothetical protein XENTR_v10010330 [Xenopus tropicalis]
MNSGSPYSRRRSNLIPSRRNPPRYIPILILPALYSSDLQCPGESPHWTDIKDQRKTLKDCHSVPQGPGG